MTVPRYIPPPRRKRSRRRRGLSVLGSMGLMVPLLLAALLPVASGAFIRFDNCLDPSYVSRSDGLTSLQFVPLFVDAKFSSDKQHNLNLTIYGNVTGQTTKGEYRSPDDPRWKDDEDGFGKIVDAPKNYATMFTNFHFLSYTPYNADPKRFCNQTLGHKCPLGPLFNANASDPADLHWFSVAHDFFSSYSFATLAAKVSVQSGESEALLACVAANITPALGRAISQALCFIPAAILALVGIATLSAARLTPWSSNDTFYWTSNHGRDDDTLRLVTPGFGDCLQYIQFIVLAGSLNLKYPGFYQPVISNGAWSVLMFNESIVSKNGGYQSLRDGLYTTNGTYGLSNLAELVGMSEEEDIWAGMAVWLCVLVASVTLLCQIGFAINWFARQLKDRPPEDLQSKNIPFTAGNIVRIVFNYFLLPIVSLCMFQFVVASVSSSVVVALAVIMLVAVVCSAAWIFRVIFTTRPRVTLFDYLPYLLAYGPLYNTYSDEAAPFAVIPVFLTFTRGIAIGAVQPSGIAQLVILAICEVILILTLHAFRPFKSHTSMNAYHTFFSVIRLISVLLSVAFVPNLGVSESTKGWIGYSILFLHAIVLIFGFFLNSVQTLIEVLARRAGAGEPGGTLTRVFGVRQLSKRVRHPSAQARPRNTNRASLRSHEAMLAATPDVDVKSKHRSAGSRSVSQASAFVGGHAYTSGPSPIPPQQGAAGDRASSMLDAGDQVSMRSGTSPGTSTPGGPQTPFYFINNANAHGRKPSLSHAQPSDPYFRTPRPKRPTLDPPIATISGAAAAGAGTVTSRTRSIQSELSAGDVTRASEVPTIAANAANSNDSPTNRWSRAAGAAGPSTTATAPFRDDSLSDDNLSEYHRRLTHHQPADYYTSRESDYYYGVRGPALSGSPGASRRRRVTGPADPMSPVASATGWFRGLFGGLGATGGWGGKKKEKGFEVVRSTPLHLVRMEEEAEAASPGAEAERYQDSPVRGSPGSIVGLKRPSLIGPMGSGLAMQQLQPMGSTGGVGGGSNSTASAMRPGIGVASLPPLRPMKTSPTPEAATSATATAARRIRTPIAEEFTGGRYAPLEEPGEVLPPLRNSLMHPVVPPSSSYASPPRGRADSSPERLAGPDRASARPLLALPESPPRGTRSLRSTATAGGGGGSGSAPRRGPSERSGRSAASSSLYDEEGGEDAYMGMGMAEDEDDEGFGAGARGRRAEVRSTGAVNQRRVGEGLVLMDGVQRGREAEVVGLEGDVGTFGGYGDERLRR